MRSTVGVAGCLFYAQSEALLSYDTPSLGVQRTGPQPLGATPVTPRGADPRGLRSRPVWAPPLGAALRMLGGAGGRAGGSDLETPEGWKCRRRRRRQDARSSVGVCGAQARPRAWRLSGSRSGRGPSRPWQRHPGSGCLSRGASLRAH